MSGKCKSGVQLCDRSSLYITSKLDILQPPSEPSGWSFDVRAREFDGPALA